jgi:hypothetical protein
LKETFVQPPYWRISIDNRQQSTLDALTRAIGETGLVCYAAPAFHRLSQLYSHTTQGTIVANSSFPNASSLSGHTAWNYCVPGAIGVANTDPKEIDEPSFFSKIEDIVRRNFGESAFSPYDANLKRLVSLLASVAEDISRIRPERSALFFQRVKEIDNMNNVGSFSRYREPFASYVKVLAFASTFGLQWFVLGNGERP